MSRVKKSFTVRWGLALAAGAGALLLSAAEPAAGELTFTVPPGQPIGAWFRWNVPLEADLAACNGFEFDIRCSDPSQLSRGFSMYIFTSKRDVYSAKFPITAVGEWMHVTLLKQCVYNTEGHPDGWDVKKFQITGTLCGTNGLTGSVRNARPLPAPAMAAAILYCERHPDDPGTKVEFPIDKYLISQLTNSGVDTYFLSDRDLVRKGVPPNVKILFIPYSGRGWREDVVATLRPWIQAGGKIGRGWIGGSKFRPLMKEFPNQFVDASRLMSRQNATAEEDLQKFLDEHMGEFAESIARNKVKRAERRKRQAQELAAIPPRPNETRTMFCHAPWGSKGACTNWEDAVKLIKAGGFNQLCVNFTRGVYAAYKSDVLKPWPGFKEKGDALEICKAACKKHGLSLAAWRCCWGTSDWLTTKEEIAERRAAGRISISRDGKEKTGFGCPTHPVNIRQEIESLVELAKKGVDCIDLDYIRYDNSYLCCCARCRQLFEKRIGRTVDNWPHALFDKKNQELAAAWEDFRCDNITYVVKTVAERIHREAPGVKLRVCAFADPINARKTVAQDWPYWCRQGWVDVVLAMDYRESTPEFAMLVQSQRKFDLGRAVICPIIGTSCWPNVDDDALRTGYQIQAARKAGCPGWGVFELDRRTEKICLPLATGPTSR